VKQGVAEWFRLQLKEKDLERAQGAHRRGMEPGQGPLRVPRGAGHPPEPVQGRAGPVQDPARPRPRPRPDRGPDLHLADRRKAGHQDHHRPAER
jgi:hypothetical protein